MSFLPKEIAAYLNDTSPERLADWLDQNPVMRNFITSSYISIRPTAIPTVQRISAYENQLGRYVHMFYRDGSHRYIFDIGNWNQTVEDIELLIRDVDEAGGTCHVERTFLILMVPKGFLLESCCRTSQPALRLRQAAD